MHSDAPKCNLSQEISALLVPPNISNEHVSCIAPAMRHASSQILFKCPTPASVFETATKTLRFALSWEGAETFAPAMQNHILTWKNAPRPPAFNTFDFEMCFAPQGRALFEHLNIDMCFAPQLLKLFISGDPEVLQ